jgi:peptidyl-prolyl cis-trans isomerase SurA
MNQRIKFALLAALLTTSSLPAVSFAQVAIDKVVAVVAGEPISQSELNERIKVNREVANRAKQKVSEAELVNYSRDELINEHLLLNRAKNARITVGDDKINAALQDMAQSNGMTLEQFKTHVGKIGGVNGWSNLNNDLKNQMMIEALMQQEISSKVKEPTAKEVDAEVARVSAIPDGPMSPQEVAVAQHIFIKNANSASLKKIQAIKARLNKGEDFGAVAKEVSENPETAANNGQIPYIGLNDKQADPTVVELARTAPLNTVSAPVKTKNGYHLFKISERTTLSLNDDAKKAMAKDALMTMRQKEATEQYFKELDDSKASLVEIKN